MITTYKNNGSNLEVIDAPIPGAWLNVVDPTPSEIECLQQLGIPQDYIIYPLDLDERPRTERENGELLIILRIPYFQGEGADIPYTTIPLGIILTENYILTVCKLENELVQEIAGGRSRDLSPTKRNRFLLRILINTANKYQSYLRKITKIVDALEDKLQLSTRNREVLELLKYQKSLTYFATALRSNELMMERLQRSQIFKMYPDDEDLLEDVLTENQQAIEMTNITNNNLSQMMDAFASIISNNLNVVMKVLASITIILSLPTMIASFYGMNVDLPFQHEPFAFLLTLGISFAISISAAYIFVKRDWF
jgi:magnesium transporter